MARTKRKEASALPPISQQRIYKAGIYSRLSVEDGGKTDVDTIETQQEMLRAFVEAQPDMTLYRSYSDNGRTGTNFDRPGFEHMMEDVRTGKIDCIVVKDLSRFGRNYLETGNYLEHIFPYLDVRFIAVNDSFDTLTAQRSEDGYIIPLKNILNDIYSKDISRKILPALRSKQEKGEFIGAWASYGYRKCANDRHRIEPNEETAQVVRNIFRWRLEGTSYQNIVRRLKEAGIPSPTKYLYLKGEVKSEKFADAQWSVVTVKKILTSEVYLGHMVQGKKKVGIHVGGKSVKLPKEEWVIVRNTHEPIIDEETFRIVQSYEKERGEAYRERLGCHDALGSSPNLIRGLVYCAHCKRHLTRYKNVTNKGTHLYYTFICPSHVKDPTSCPFMSIHESDVLPVIRDILRSESRLAGQMEERLRVHSRSVEAREKEFALTQEEENVRQDYSKAKRLYDSLFPYYAEHLMTEKEYVQMKLRYQADMDRAEEMLEEIASRRQALERQGKNNPWLSAFGKVGEEQELTPELAHALIERIEIDKDNRISITLRYRDCFKELEQLIEGKV